jgi:hypothetical protein
MEEYKAESLFKHQGDITFQEIGTLPQGAQDIAHDGEYIIAWGETTGHKHKASGEMKVCMNGDDIFLVAIKDIKITHEEHGTIVLPKGKVFLVGKEREKDWFALIVRAVND